jgi:hypothetical protein
MWPLFRPFPPIAEVRVSVREIVAAGALVQRELVEASKFSSLARERGFAHVDRELLETLDERGFICPLGFVRGGWTSWRSVEPYPLDGIEFREENGFRPWADYEYEREGFNEVTALYSEWQLLYLPIAREANITQVPSEVLLEGGNRLVEWAESLRWFVESNYEAGAVLNERWLPTLRALLRLQARYWPYVSGRSAVLYNAKHEPVDPLDVELRAAAPDEVLNDLGLTEHDVRAEYEWFAHRAQSFDPAERLYELLRLQPRREAERERGARRAALDLYDAAEVFRRFHRDLTGELLPDVDQLMRDDPEPRRLGREPGQLVDALRRTRLYPHRLHIVAEGETEVRVVKRLFEAFASRPWEGAGIEITDLGGDKLQGSRAMLEGFGVYARSVVLLLDNENDVQRVTTRLQGAGSIADLHVTLCEPSLEEENFSTDELVDIAKQLAATNDQQLTLTGAELADSVNSRNEGRKRRKGMASILQELARAPQRGGVNFTKPELGDAMADALLREIDAAPGKHDEVGQRRPIVEWVIAYPLRAYRQQ